jgi:hypothetical protein
MYKIINGSPSDCSTQNEVWSQTSGWEAKMLTEEKEAEESIKQIKVVFDS